MYVGGFSGDYYPGYTDPNLSALPGGGDYQAAPPAAPAVVINQYFDRAAWDLVAHLLLKISNVCRSYSQSAATHPSHGRLVSAAPEPRTYLIAYKDHSVYSALAYWVEDHTLNYVTTQNTHNQADVNRSGPRFHEEAESGPQHGVQLDARTQASAISAEQCG